MSKGRLLTGHRPTGRRHLGHLVGTLWKWAELQDQYDCLFLLADLHVLTTDYAHTAGIADNVYETLYDWLAAGISPQRSTIFLQSHVPEHYQLFLLLSMLATVSRLERNPTYKEQRRELGPRATASLGFLAYPVLQAADILVYRAAAVPVGEDQLPHLELTRELARRFNNSYGDLFPEPQAILSRTPRLIGLDGRTMHASYGNTIALAEEPDVIRRKVMSMVTDPQRLRAATPGRPEVCTVFALLRAVFPDQALGAETMCRGAEIGCVPCKAALAEDLVRMLEPFRQIRSRLSPADLDEIIRDGLVRARPLAGETIDRVMSLMRLDRVPTGQIGD